MTQILFIVSSTAAIPVQSTCPSQSVGLPFGPSGSIGLNAFEDALLVHCVVGWVSLAFARGFVFAFAFAFEMHCLHHTIYWTKIL